MIEIAKPVGVPVTNTYRILISVPEYMSFPQQGVIGQWKFCPAAAIAASFSCSKSI